MKRNKKNLRNLYLFHLIFHSKQFLIQELGKDNKFADSEYESTFNKKVNNTIFFMLFLWILQRKGMISGDKNFFFNNFQKLTSSSEIPFFLARFAEEIIFNQEINSQLQKKGEKTPWSSRIDPLLFYNHDLHPIKIIPLHQIPHYCLITEESSGKMEIESANINETQLKKQKPLKKIPIFNAFHLFEQNFGEITEGDLGDLFERMLHSHTKSKTGAFYTPDYICQFIAENLIVSRIILPIIQKYENIINFQSNLSNFQEILKWNPADSNKIFQVVINYLKKENKEISKKIIKDIFDALNECRILDPAVGAGEFLLSMDETILKFLEPLWRICRNRDFREILLLRTSMVEYYDLIQCGRIEEVNFLFRRYVIYPKMLFGVDIYPTSCFIARWRLYLRIIEKITPEKNKENEKIYIPMNIRYGNSLFGWVSWNELDFALNKGRTHKISINITQRMEETHKNLILQVELMKKNSKSIFNKISPVLLGKFGLQSQIKNDNSNLINYLIPFFQLLSLMRMLRIYSTNCVENIAICREISKFSSCIGEFLDFLYGRVYKTKIPSLFHWILEFSELFPTPAFLFQPNPSEYYNPGFDIIIGNPPYGNLLSEPEKKVIDVIWNAYDLNKEVSSVFLARTIPLLKMNGNVGFLTSYTISFNKKLSKLRQELTEILNEIFLITFDRDKCRLFENMTQSVSIFMGIRRHPKLLPKNLPEFNAKWYTTAMYRRFPSFENLQFQLANDFLLSSRLEESFTYSHRIPKIGFPESASLLSILKKWQNNYGFSVGNWLKPAIVCENKEKLIELEKKFQPSSQNGIWVRISGNYWYNAWDRVPYFGTQIAYIPFDSTDESIQDFLLILINSSLYYWWFRIFSDGRHMNQDILSAFPLPLGFNSRLKEFTPLLKYFRTKLMGSLFNHYDSQRKRFLSSQIKPLLDLGDFLLGVIFRIPVSLILYVIQVDFFIRGSITQNKTAFSLCKAWYSRHWQKKYSEEMFEEITKIIDLVAKFPTELENI